MTFSVAKRDSTVVIGIDGHLVVGNRQALKRLVLDALARGERRFRVDFTRTRYVDSSGLGVLVAMSKKVIQERGVMILANLDADIRTLFVLTKLDTLFQFEDGGAAADDPRAAADRPMAVADRPMAVADRPAAAADDAGAGGTKRSEAAGPP